MKTPNGGVREEILFFNDKGEPVPKDEATIAIIREYDEKGNLIAETRGTLG